MPEIMEPVVVLDDDGNHVVEMRPGFLPDPTPREVNEKALREKAAQALTANTAFINAAKPNTAAQVASAAYDQTKVLTRECNAVIRLLLGALDDTAGT